MINEFQYFDDEIKRIEQIPNKKEFIREFRIWYNKALKHIENNKDEIMKNAIFHGSEVLSVAMFFDFFNDSIDYSNNIEEFKENIPYFETSSFPAMIVFLMHMSTINRLMLDLPTINDNKAYKVVKKIMEIIGSGNLDINLGEDD